MKQYEVLTWNINQRSGHGFDGNHSFAFEIAAKENKDIVVFTEICKKGNFQEKLEECFPNYNFVSTDNESGQNDILMGIRKGIEIKSVKALYSAKENDNPNYLQLLLSDGEHEWVQIGVRIRVCRADDMFYFKQMDIINNMLGQIPEIIPVYASGDWNAYASSVEKNISQKHSVYSPVHRKEYYYTNKFIDNYSFLFSKDGRIVHKGCLDHSIANSGIVVGEAVYKWDFIEESPIYPSRNELLQDDVNWNIPVGMPDHAMLLTSIGFVEN